MRRMSEPAHTAKDDGIVNRRLVVVIDDFLMVAVVGDLREVVVIDGPPLSFDCRWSPFLTFPR